MGLRLLIIVAAAVLAVPVSARGYELTWTESGQLGRWPTGPVVVDLSPAGSGIDRDATLRAMKGAFLVWEPHLPFAIEFVEVGPIGSDSNDRLNVVRWITDPMDPAATNSEGALARTWRTYRADTGEILDADILINAVGYRWKVSGHGSGDEDDDDEEDERRYDLQNVLAHEVGHFLGLGHSQELEATMFERTGDCEIKKRDLSPDDLAGLDVLYGRESLAGSGAAPSFGCAAAGSNGQTLAIWWLSALVWALRRRHW